MAGADFTHFPLEELVYASDLEKAYGLSDDAYAHCCRQQMFLERFSHEPSCSGGLANMLDALARKGAWLAGHGFDPTERNNVFETACVDFVHSTAALEGSTLSVRDVALVLGEGAVIPGHTLRDHLEVVDINEAFELAVGFAREERPLDAALVKEVHAVASRHLEDCEHGVYRCDQRYVTGSSVLPPPPAMVEQLTDQLIGWYNEQPSVERTALFHLVFEDIHPFQDGNGRTGRILMNFMLMSLGFPAISFKSDHDASRAYHAAVADFAAAAEQRDGTAMVQLVAQALDEAINRYALCIEQSE